MDSLTFFECLWFFLIFLLIGGYFVLDGFDLGIGVLSPFVAKTSEEKHVLRRAIGPIWDGNEVWLLTAGGALFAAFPNAYATTFSGFYLAIMLVLFGLIVRAVSFEFAEGDPRWKGVWNVCFFLGSLLPALLLGVAVGNIYAGIPMDADGNYMGVPLLGLITPFTLLTGVLGLFMFLAAGACWGALKVPINTPLQKRMAGLRLPLQIIVLILFCAETLYALLLIKPDMDPILLVARIIFLALFVVGIVGSLFFGRKGNDLYAFMGQSLGALSLVGILGSSMFPNLVLATPESIHPAITIANAASSDLALICMTVILCIGLPLVLIYHVIIYRTFRGRLSAEDLQEGY